MASKKTTQRASALPSAGDADIALIENQVPETHMGELEKVRSILFGEQLRVYEERIAQIEALMKASVAEMRQTMEDKLGAFESSVHEKLQGLTLRLDQERSEREKLQTLLAGDLEGVGARLEESQASLQKTMDEALGALQREQKSTAQSLEEKIEKLTESVQAVNHDKTNRAHLAQLLTHIARELERDAS